MIRLPWSRLAVLSAFVLALLLGSLPPVSGPGSEAADPDPLFASGLWLATGDGLVELDPTSGAVETVVATTPGTRRVAVDGAAGLVWSLGDDGGLLAVDLAGEEQASLEVNGAGGEAALLVAGGGTVWVRSQGSIRGFDATGAAMAEIPVRGNPVALELDPVGSFLWLATRSEVAVFDLDGTELTRLDLGRGTSIQDLAADRATGDLWIAGMDRLWRLDPDDGLALEIAVSPQGGGARLVAADGAGGVWMARGDGVEHLDRAGDSLGGAAVSESIRALVADPDGGVWILTVGELVHLGSGAGGLELFDLSALGLDPVRDLALYADLEAPELVWISPSDGDVLTTDLPELVLEAGDGAVGVDPDTLAISLGSEDGLRVDVACELDGARFVCQPAAPLPLGVVTLVATVDDFAGNTSAPATVEVEIATELDLAPVGDLILVLGDELRLALEATPGRSGASLAFAAEPLPLPEGARLDGATGLFTFRPAPDQVGRTYPLAFTVTDGFSVDREKATLTVVAPAPGTPTSLAGRVLDTNDAVAGVITPIVGVRVSLLGGSAEAITDGDGRFELAGIAGGDQVLDFDSSAALPAPDGSPYAGFREKIALLDGTANRVARPFYLPRIDRASLTTVDPTTTTRVTNPNLGTTLTVAAGSALGPDGTLYTGQLSLSEVPAALAPVALPEELSPGLLLTVQPVGVTFTQPVPLSMPNLDDLAPGSEVDLWSVNPSTGQFEIVGTGRVSADGSRVDTVSGGITAASWHALLPPGADGDGSGNNGDNQDPDRCDDCSAGSQTALASGNLSVSHDLTEYFSLGRSRSLRFVYNSTAADPRPILSSNTTVPVRSTVPRSLSASLVLGGVDRGGAVYTSTAGLSENRDETVRQVLQVDARDLPTGAYPYQMRLASHFTSSTMSSFVRDRLLVDNRSASPYGAGWGISGIHRLHPTADDGLVLSEGDGTLQLFQGSTFRFDAPDFADLSRFQINGTARSFGNPVATASGPVLRLTTNGGNQSSSAFLTSPVVIGAGGTPVSWSSAFQVRISNPRNGGADGLVFVLADGPGRLGGLGGGMGYAGVSPSLGVELDTWNNGGIDGNSDNHVGINLNGNLASVARANAPTTLENGQVKFVWVDYDGPSRRLEVRLAESPTRPAAALIGHTVDLPALLGGDEAYFGFSSGTGGANALHDVLAWSVASEAEGVGNYIAPPGDFSVLEGGAGAGWVRTFKDGSRHVFDGAGFQTGAIDRNGNETTYAYDGAGRLTSIVDPAGLETTLVYSGGRLASVVDPGGRTTRFEQSGVGDLTRIVDPDGAARGFAYDGAHRLVRQVSKRGFAVTYGYDFAGRNVSVVRTDGSTRAITPKDCIGLVDPASGLGSASAPAPFVRPEDARATYVGGRGATLTYDTDRFGAAVSTIDSDGRRTTAARNADGNPTRVDNPNGSATEFTYDDEGNLTSIVQEGASGARRSMAMEYDPDLALVTRIVDPAGNSLAIEYDGGGNATRLTDALGGEARATYDARGLITSTTDQVGAVTRFTYDPAGNLQTLTDALGTVTRMERDGLGRVVAVVEAEGLPEERTTRYAYDTANRVSSITDPRGGVLLYRYDASGNAVEIESPTGEIIRQSYDTMNRVEEVEAPSGGTTSYAYDASGNVTQVTDAKGAVSRFEYDDRNRLVRTVDALGNEQEIAYDGRGNITSTTDGRGAVTRFEYDELDRLVRQVDALGQVSMRSYDERNYLTAATDAEGRVFGFEYDALGRPTVTTYPDDVVRRTYDPAGRLVAIEDGDSRLDYSLDALGRTTAVTVADVGVQPEVTLGYTYDPLGRRVGMTDTRGGSVAYGYDEAGQLVELVGPGGRTYRMAYDLAGRTEDVEMASGISLDYQWDDDGRLDTLEYRTDAGATLHAYSYLYDALGNLLTIVEGARVREYSYDALERLTEGGTAGLPEVYEYDEVGNRVSSFLSSSYVYDAANRLVEDDDFGYTYDRTGRLLETLDKTTGALTRYAWNARGQLEEIDLPDGSTASYRYDALGRRIEKRFDDGTAVTVRRTIYDGANALLETDETGAVVARYTFAGTDRPLAMERGGATYEYLVDHLGSVRFLVDDTGAQVNSYEYDSFGQLLAATEGVENPYTYTGRVRDAESGLYFYRARYYDARLGRFLSPDPLGPAGGDPTLYVYTSNNPVNHTDPSGLFSFWDVLDVVSFGLSLNDFLECPSLENGLWLALDTISLLPIIPSIGAIKRGIDALDAASDVGRTLNRTEDAVDVASDVARRADNFDELGDAARRSAPCNCFAGGTEVKTEDGETAVEEIEAGDRVWARDPETGRYQLESVLGVFEREVDGLLVLEVDGEEVETTPSHRFWIEERGWVEAGELAVGDLLASYDGTPRRVASVETRPGVHTVYDFEVASAHSYFATGGEVLVHNCDLPRPDWAQEGLDDLARFRDELGPVPSANSPDGGVLSRLDVGGDSFYGINAHGQDVSMRVNNITRTHAEADAFQQAYNAGVRGGEGRLFVDADLCGACGTRGGVRGLARQLGLDRLEVVTPSGIQVIVP